MSAYQVNLKAQAQSCIEVGHQQFDKVLALNARAETILPLRDIWRLHCCRPYPLHANKHTDIICSNSRQIAQREINAFRIIHIRCRLSS